MKNLETWAYKASLESPMIDDHGAFEKGYDKGWRECLHQVVLLTVSLPDTRGMMIRLEYLAKWMESEENTLLEFKDTKESPAGNQ